MTVDVQFDSVSVIDASKIVSDVVTTGDRRFDYNVMVLQGSTMYNTPLTHIVFGRDYPRRHVRMLLSDDGGPSLSTGTHVGT